MDNTKALTAVDTLCLAKMAGCSDRYGHLMACLKAAYLYSTIQQILANNFGTSLLLSATDTCVPKPGNMEKGCNPPAHPGLA